MDPNLLRYYNQELLHLREMGAEFARQFPKIAARLGMDGIAVADPYVERLLEGTAFLTARVQLKLDAEFPRFTQRLLDIVYPNHLAPMPAMAIARFEPVPGDKNVAEGYVIDRGTQLRSARTTVGDTPCTFVTAQPVTLAPLEVVSLNCAPHAADLSLGTLPVTRRPRGIVRIRLKATGGLKFQQIGLDRLRLFLNGMGDVPARLYEALLGEPLGIVAGPPVRGKGSKGAESTRRFLAADSVRAVGFEDAEAMLPVTLRGFAGNRLVQEYFAFPQRFFFVDLVGLRSAFAACDDECELTILCSRPVSGLEGVVDASNVLLNCVPVVNLFERQADRIHLSDTATEFHVVMDRTQPLGYEVHSIVSVTGFGSGGVEQQFHPFYCAFHDESFEGAGYFSARREPRLITEQRRREGPRSSYVGSEVYLSLVDPREAPLRHGLRQLGVRALCTNRDLPLFMAIGSGRSDFTLETGAPVTAIRVVAGPSRPKAPPRDAGAPWQFVNQLSMNYLALRDAGDEEGAALLRMMLRCHADVQDATVSRQIDGLRSVSAQQVVRRFPVPGPIAFARGTSVTLRIDEQAFEGTSPFLFGSILSHYLRRQASMNSFTETRLVSEQRGEIMLWPAKIGSRATL